jgi:hypothetical protein
MVPILDALGMALVAIGRAQPNASTMRSIVLAKCPLWLAHAIFVRAPIAFVDATSLALGLWVLMH